MDETKSLEWRLTTNKWNNLEAENAALRQQIDKLELRINSDDRNFAYADAEIGRLRARIAELEAQLKPIGVHDVDKYYFAHASMTARA